MKSITMTLVWFICLVYLFCVPLSAVYYSFQDNTGQNAMLLLATFISGLLWSAMLNSGADTTFQITVTKILDQISKVLLNNNDVLNAMVERRNKEDLIIIEQFVKRRIAEEDCSEYLISITKTGDIIIKIGDGDLMVECEKLSNDNVNDPEAIISNAIEKYKKLKYGY